MRLIWGICFILFGCSAPQGESNTKIVQEQINIRLGESINKLNPLLSGTGYAKQVEELIYLSLFQFDPVSLSLKPTLAKEETSIEELGSERLRIGFEIKEKARWSDGKPVTARDYLFTFKMIFNPDLNTHGYRAYLSFIDKMEVDTSNEKKIWIWTKQKYHLAQTVLSNIQLFPEHIHDPKYYLRSFSIDDLRKKEKGSAELVELSQAFSNYGNSGSSEIIGSGPYEIKDWIPQESILLELKDDYWANGLEIKPAQLSGLSKRIKFKIIKDQQSALQELHGGGIDIMNQAPLLAFQEKKNAEELQFFSPNQFTYYYIALNPNHSALSTPNDRKAINKCVDVKSWISQQMNGLATQVTNPISPLLPYYDEKLIPIAYQPESAIDHFEQKGFTQLDSDGIRYRLENGIKERLSLTLAYSSANDLAATLGLFFKENAKPTGLEIRLQPMELKPMRQDYRTGKYDMIFLASSAPPADYDPQQSWHTKSWNGSNRVKFGNPKSDRIIDRICSSINAEERHELYQDFQQEIYAAQPFIFLYSPKQRVIARKGIEVTPANVWPGYVSQLLE